MTAQQAIQFVTALGTLVAAFTAAWHAWQTRKTVNTAAAPPPPASPAVPPSSVQPPR